MNTNNTITTNSITKTNQELWFLSPLYKGFGILDNQTSVNWLKDGNKRIIASLQETLVNKNWSDRNKLYIADLWITTTPENLEHNQQSLKQLYTGVMRELKADFDVQLLSLTELKQAISPFYGTESHGTNNQELRLYFSNKWLHSIKQFHQYLDQLYTKSNLHTPIPMKSFFQGPDKNKIQLLGNR